MKYWTKHGMMGMMGKYGFLSDSSNFYFKNSKNIACFDIGAIFGDFKTSYNYISEKDFEQIPKKNIKSKYFLTQTVSLLNQDFFNLSGKRFKEIRETRNKFNKLVSIKIDTEVSEILKLIDLWDNLRGFKYGWQRHSGFDRNFFNRFYLQEKENLQSLFFYINGKLVGYSIISLEFQDNCYNYIIRKNNTEYRNLCLYIDYKSFEVLHHELKKPFLINWGASSGTLLKYKEKFPIYKQEKMYFFKLKE